jgi:hypothetical protein
MSVILLPAAIYMILLILTRSYKSQCVGGCMVFNGTEMKNLIEKGLFVYFGKN